MSTETPAPQVPTPGPDASGVPGPRQRLRLGALSGAATSIVTTILAFLVAGLVVLAVGSDPIKVYKGIWDGTGLAWFNPFLGADDREFAVYNLQQTLLIATTLAFTGLAVAFAFRCGLFNIGGQGQWTVGAVASVWFGGAFAGMNHGMHVVLAILLAALAGALWGGIAGILKATVGAHEVITTIMLNWIAIFGGMYLFGLGGPLQNDTDKSVPISADIVAGAKIPVFWGDAELQGLHVGFFLAVAALVAYWLILARTTLGFRVRAVGRNPEAARYGGINVPRSYFTAMAISGGFAGLGGAMDVLGWQYRIGTLDIRTSTIGFAGIAVALLGRNSAIGVGFASLLFGALLYGTSSRSIDATIIAPQLAGNLTLIIQGLVLLFIGIDVVLLALWKSRRLPVPSFGFLRRSAVPERVRPAVSDKAAERYAEDAPPLSDRLAAWASARAPRGPKAFGVGAVLAALAAALVALPPFTVRAPAVPVVLGLAAVALAVVPIRAGLRRLGWVALALGVLCAVLGVAATRSSVTNLEAVVIWSALFAAMLRQATPLIFASIAGVFSERPGVVNVGLEGMMLSGAFFGLLGAEKSGSWVVGIVTAVAAGLILALIHGIWSIHFRADQIVSGMAINFLALGLTGFLFVDVYGPEGTPEGIPHVPDVTLGFLDGVPFLGDAIGSQNLLVWVALGLVVVSSVVIFKTRFGLRLRAVGEHPRAADTLGISVYRTRYYGVLISGALAALGGAFLSIGYLGSFNENMTAGRGFIALAAMIFGNWKPKGALAACLLFGFSGALAQRLQVYSDSASVLFEALPYVLTLIAVAGVLARPRAPAADGIPYAKQ